MALRRRHVALTLSVLVLAAGAVVGGTWLHDRNEARAEGRRIEARLASLQPARSALRAIPRPAGYTGCPTRPDADLCWSGTGLPQKATPVLLDALRGAGATELSARCVRRTLARTVTYCRVSGTLKGSVLDTLVDDTQGHLQVIAYAATQQPPDILKNGTPIPVG